MLTETKIWTVGQGVSRQACSSGFGCECAEFQKHVLNRWGAKTLSQIIKHGSANRPQPVKFKLATSSNSINQNKTSLLFYAATGSSLGFLPENASCGI